MSLPQEWCVPQRLPRESKAANPQEVGKNPWLGLEPLRVSRSGVSWGPRERPPVEERVCSAEQGLGLPEPGPLGTFAFGWLQEGQRTVSELQ